MHNHNNCYIKVFYFSGDCVCPFHPLDVVCMHFIALHDCIYILKYIYTDIAANIYFLKEIDRVIKKCQCSLKHEYEEL